METKVDSPVASYSIDLGLHFACSRTLQLFRLSVLPIALKLVSLLMKSAGDGSLQWGFLSEVVGLFSDVWLLSVVVMLVLSCARDRDELRSSQLLLKSLQFLPKVFLSYCAFFIVVQSGLLLFPLLVFAIFFLWAPYFCIAESFIEPPRRAREEEQFEYEEDDAEDASKAPIRWFSAKTLLELGFARSVHLVGAHSMVTLQLVLLMMAGNFLPVAVVNLLSPTYSGNATLLIAVSVAMLTMSLVLACAGVVFVACIPAEAREELGISPRWEWQLLNSRSSRFRFQGRPFAILLLTLITAGSTYLLYRSEKASQLPPPSAVVSIESVSRQAERVNVEFRLSDPQAELSWFTASGLRVQLRGDEQKSAAPELLKPQHIRYRNTRGTFETLSTSGNLGESATLSLYVDIPEASTAREAEVVYLTQFGDKAVLTEFLLPKERQAK